MSAAKTYTLHVENYRSETPVKVYEVTVVLTNEEGDPLPNIDGAYSHFVVRRFYGAEEALVDVDTDSGNITIDHETGEIKLELNSNDLELIPSTLEEAEYVYDWDLVNTNDEFFRILRGTIIFIGDL